MRDHLLPEQTKGVENLLMLRRPDGAQQNHLLVMGRDLLLRTMAFQACFVSAGAVAARLGAAAGAAHQVVLQLWNFLARVLDSA